jgi:hypothetical protein
MRTPAHFLSLTTACWLIACASPDSRADDDGDTTSTSTSGETSTMGETSGVDETGDPEGAECQADL